MYRTPPVLFSWLFLAPYCRQFLLISLSSRHLSTMKALSSCMRPRDASAGSPPSRSRALLILPSQSCHLLHSPSFPLLLFQLDLASVFASLALPSLLVDATPHRRVIKIISRGKVVVVWPMVSAYSRPSLPCPHFPRLPQPYFADSINSSNCHAEAAVLLPHIIPLFKSSTLNNWKPTALHPLQICSHSVLTCQFIYNLAFFLSLNLFQYTAFLQIRYNIGLGHVILTSLLLIECSLRLLIWIDVVWGSAV